MKRMVLAALGLFVAASAGEAQAQWGWQGNGAFYGRNVYTVYDQDRLPYFALHPPVYYSYPPVPRTFGYSPFAYPPCVMTPEHATAAVPETIVNPYFETVPQGNGAAPAPGANGTQGKTAPGTNNPSPPRIRESNAVRKPGADQSASNAATKNVAKSTEPKALRIVNPYSGPMVGSR